MEDEKCFFCKRKKSVSELDAIGRERGWNSSISIFTNDIQHPLRVITVCPECRGKHKIQEIYGVPYEETFHSMKQPDNIKKELYDKRKI